MQHVRTCGALGGLIQYCVALVIGDGGVFSRLIFVSPTLLYANSRRIDDGADGVHGK
jgi:hypothetical protein